MIRYIELRSAHGDCGPAWIARVRTSRTHSSRACLEAAGPLEVPKQGSYSLESSMARWNALKAR